MKISEPRDLQKIVKMMRKQGILTLKTAEIEISLDPKHSSTHRVVGDDEQLKKDFNFPVGISDEEMLFYSVPDANESYQSQPQEEV